MKLKYLRIPLRVFLGVIKIAYADVLSGDIEVRINPRISTLEGGIEGERSVAHKIVQALSDGSGANAAVGFFSTTATATTGGITLSMANADPLGAAGDDFPTETAVEGTKLKLIMFENTGDTNAATVEAGAAPDSNVLTGSTDEINLSANGGFFLWYSPAGINALSDGVDDEFLIKSAAATTTVKITFIYG